jgi:hypothetical protein
MPPSHPGPQAPADGFPTADTVRRLVTRGRPATFPLASAASWAQVLVAANGLRAAVAPDGLLVIPSPGSGSARPPSLKVIRLIDEADVRRLHDQIRALVAEFRELAHRLAVPFRLHVEPACERGDEHPDELEVDGETWSLHIHGEHCLFTSLTSGTEVEVNTDRPDVIDPWFLLQYAMSADRYPSIRTACTEGFHDMCRMLDLTAIPLGHACDENPDAAGTADVLPW